MPEEGENYPPIPFRIPEKQTSPPTDLPPIEVRRSQHLTIDEEQAKKLTSIIQDQFHRIAYRLNLENYEILQ